MLYVYGLIGMIGGFTMLRFAPDGVNVWDCGGILLVLSGMGAMIAASRGDAAARDAGLADELAMRPGGPLWKRLISDSSFVGNRGGREVSLTIRTAKVGDKYSTDYDWIATGTVACSNFRRLRLAIVPEIHHWWETRVALLPPVLEGHWPNCGPFQVRGAPEAEARALLARVPETDFGGLRASQPTGDVVRLEGETVEFVATARNGAVPSARLLRLFDLCLAIARAAD